MSALGSMAQALRPLRGKSLFVAVVLATLALSLGGATAMFSVVNSFLLSSLPFAQADRLVLIWRTHPESAKSAANDQLPLSPGDFADLDDRHRSFERVAALASEFVNVTSTAEPQRIHMMAVSREFFPLLRLRVALGRGLEPADADLKAARVVVISHAYWQRELGGDPRVLGRKLEISGGTFEIVGVLPQDFHFVESLVPVDPSFSRPADAWAPLRLREGARERGYHALVAVGRLLPKVSLQAAQEEVRAYAAHAAEQYPDSKGYGMRVVSLSEQIFGHLRPVLLALLAATGFVVLIGCVNLAALLTARGEAGQREVAVRVALGASRLRILGESLLQSATLALAGGLLGLLVALAATRLLARLSPLGVFHSYPIQVDARVLGFTLVAALLCGLLFGLAPALRASRVDAAIAVREGGRGATGRSRLTLFPLVVAEVALTTTLLIGSGLSLESFVGLLRADLGMNLDRVLTAELFLPFNPYRDAHRKVGLLHDILDRIQALPGVQAVGMNYALPFSGVDPSNGLTIVGRPPQKDDEKPSANLGLVNGGYFAALGIQLLRGRTFGDSDTEDRQQVAIIDERLVKQYFPNEEPLGRQVRIADDQPRTIVGIVGAVKQDAFEEKPRPYVYLPYQQLCTMNTRLAIKTRGADPLRLVPLVRGVVKDLDKDLPVANVSTLSDAYRTAIAPQRFSMLLVTLFAAIALLLSQVGIYGVMNFLSLQRRREAGIRMALGAAPSHVFRLFVRPGLLLSLAGAALGLTIALLAGKVLASLAYGIGTIDLAVFCTVPVLTVLAAFLAYFRPARALSGTDPMESLRSE